MLKLFSRLILAVSLYAAAAAADGNGVPGKDIVISGTVTVREADGTVIVVPKKGKGKVLRVRKGTRIVRDGKEVGLSGLKVGDQVVVRLVESELVFSIIPASAVSE